MAAVLTAGERRRAPRAGPLGLGLAGAAVLRPGVPVGLVSISRVGALVVSHAQVRPGARTDLSIEALAGDRWIVGVVVVRCWVEALAPLRYRAALEFDVIAAEGRGSGYPSFGRVLAGSSCPSIE